MYSEQPSVSRWSLWPDRASRTAVTRLPRHRNTCACGDGAAALASTPASDLPSVARLSGIGPSCARSTTVANRSREVATCSRWIPAPPVPGVIKPGAHTATIKFKKGEAVAEAVAGQGATTHPFTVSVGQPDPDYIYVQCPPGAEVAPGATVTCPLMVTDAYDNAIADATLLPAFAATAAQLLGPLWDDF